MKNIHVTYKFLLVEELKTKESEDIFLDDPRLGLDGNGTTGRGGSFAPTLSHCL